MQSMSDQTDWEEPESFVNQHIRRVSRNLLLWNGIVLGLLAIIVLLLWSYLGWFFRGPKLVDDAFILDAAKGPSSSLIAYIEMRDRQLVPTGYVEESTKNGKVYSTNPYYFIAVGDKLMLVKATTDTQGQKLLGPLESISVKSDQQAFDAIVAKNPMLRDRILPVMLNAAAAFPVFGYVFLAILTPILALCGFNIARALIRQGNNSVHPVIRSLARQGDPTEVAQDVDAEMAEDGVQKVGKAFMTQNWLLRPTFFRLIACRLDDIVWAFHAKIVGDNVASFAFRDGRMFGIPLHKNTPELLAHIHKRVPWVEKGWNKEKAKKWRTQREDFIAAVEARRKRRNA
jgi:hypothetical protein